jgi:hypothetical protein
VGELIGVVEAFTGAIKCGVSLGNFTYFNIFRESYAFLIFSEGGCKFYIGFPPFLDSIPFKTRKKLGANSGPI